MNPLKVLIIEDEITSQILLQSALVKWGYAVSVVDCAEKAFEILQQDLPNIILTDWVLPGMNGPEFCLKIRALNMEHYVYIIMITGLSDVNSVISGFTSGADDFLSKPVCFQELKARLLSGERVIKLEERLISQNTHLNEMTQGLMAAEANIRREMEFAEKVQFNLLPANGSRINDAFLSYIYQSSLYVSGDFLSYFAVTQEVTGFFSVDVCGHGVAAAMMSFSVSKIIAQFFDFKRPSLVGEGGNELFKRPDQLVSYLNEVFYKNNDFSLYFSIVLGFINHQNKTFSFCQAGHPHPIYISPHASALTLGQGGFPVALLPTPAYESVVLSYQTGDRLFVYSDGVVDCTNQLGEQYNSTRLIDYLEGHHDIPLNQLTEQLKTHLLDWHGTDKFDDDISLLAIEFV